MTMPVKGDVVYGPLPIEGDGKRYWGVRTHYALVLGWTAEDRLAVMVGTSKRIPSDDGALLRGEIAFRCGTPRFKMAGLKVETLFKPNHRFLITRNEAARLEKVGRWLV